MGKVLVFAPHNDDEIIGCGGTIALLVESGNEVTVCEVTSGKNRDRVELIRAEARKAHSIVGVMQTIFMDLPAVDLNSVSQIELTKKFSDVVNKVKPEIVFLPHKGDMHLDHRIVSDSVMVAVRPIQAPFVKRIFAYETLSETEWNIPSQENTFNANYWFDISETLCEKLEAMKCYQTQLKEFPHPRSIEAIESLAKLRGSTIGASAAEAFMLIRGIE